MHPSPEQQRQRTNKKVPAAINLVKSKSSLPVPEIISHGRLEKNGYYLLQEFLPGNPAGNMELKNNAFVFHIDNPKHIEELERAIPSLHQIEVDGFGFLEVEDGIAKGRFKTWNEFIRTMSDEWIERIYKFRLDAGLDLSEEDFYELSDKISKFLDDNKAYLSFERACLLHGDLGNPGNMLFLEGKLTALLDWEWALAGDPAWEFAWAPYFTIEQYLASCKKQGIDVQAENFKERVDTLKVIWTL